MGRAAQCRWDTITQTNWPRKTVIRAVILDIEGMKRLEELKSPQVLRKYAAETGPTGQKSSRIWRWRREALLGAGLEATHRTQGGWALHDKLLPGVKQLRWQGAGLGRALGYNCYMPASACTALG